MCSRPATSCAHSMKRFYPVSNQACFLSIVTPTYNRAHLLGNCFASLMCQTDKDFEWVIVDDGSSDDTKQVVQKFAGDFPITYVYKENGGKHTALNRSHEYIHGKYVLILDSDDYLTDTAVEKVKAAWAQFEGQEEIGIVTLLKGQAEDDPSCKAPDEGVPVDIMRYKRICIHSSDCCEVIRTELFLKYPFPVFPGERFVSEGALWNRVSFTHKCVYINQVVYIADYLEGGLTKSGRAMRIRNPYGGMFTSNLNMNRKNFFSRRIKNGLLYTSYGFFAGLSPWKIITRDKESRCLKALCMLPGYVLYRRWRSQFPQQSKTMN